VSGQLPEGSTDSGREHARGLHAGAGSV
jgi:hypothetical protein